MNEELQSDLTPAVIEEIYAWFTGFILSFALYNLLMQGTSKKGVRE